MSDHMELTSEVRQIADLLEMTKYHDEKKHPSIHAAVKRLKQALHQYGCKDLLPPQVTKVSEEVREKLYDNQLAPLVAKIEEYSQRYDMPALVVIEWGDATQCAVLRQWGDTMPCPRLQLAALAESCDGNVDLFIQKVCAIAKTVGHNSEALEKLGIPREPDDDIRGAAKGV